VKSSKPLVCNQLLFLCILTIFLILSNQRLNAALALPGEGELPTVRELVNSGAANFFVLDKRFFVEKTVIDLVLVDLFGKSVGGYAPPFLQTMKESRRLWRDFVSFDLSTPSTEDQITISEERSGENESFAVCFVLDYSPSMTKPLAIRMQKAVRHVLSNFDSLDYASVVIFTGSVHNEVPITNDKEEALSGFKVNGINLRHNGSAVYDAVMKGISELAKIEDVSRRVLILFTDGEDNSSAATVNEVMAAAIASNVTVYGVTYGMANDVPIEMIASASNGKVYRLHEIYDFDRAFLGIYNALRHQYTISVKLKNDFVDESSQNATMTAMGASMSSIGTPYLLSMLPKRNSQVAPSGKDSNIVLSVGMNFAAEDFTVSSIDEPMIDSIATMLIQHADIGVEILNSSEQSQTSADGANLALRRAQAIRDLLIRRGVPPSRVQSYSGKGSPNMKTVVSDQRRTTFVFTKL